MKIGIIGGSGLEKGDILQNLTETEISTFYGKVRLKKGILNDVEVFIISRHGEGHEITPSNVNNRANIAALVNVGCKQIIATTACGSLREKIKPGEFVVVNQFIDFTRKRETTFFQDFKEGIKHTSMADPFSAELRTFLIDSCEELRMPHHKIGTVITVEGPRFSTRAESFMFRKFAHVINMSTAPEAVLANEAGLEYAVVAMVTDYDCWRKGEKPVTWEQVMRTMERNSENVKNLLVRTIEKISSYDESKQRKSVIKSKIRTIPNWPKQGVMFRDITTLLKDQEGMEKVVELLYERYKDKGVDIIAGIESRGFIFGSLLASRLGVGFVPIRKPGKLPSETLSQEYELEYGKDKIEIHKDAVSLGQRVLIIDDLIATGGTAQASAQLVEKLGGQIVECGFVIELPDLNGREKLSKWPVFSIVSFEGE